MKDLFYYISASLVFIETVLLPTLFAIALLFFIFNVARYFIFKANDETARSQAKRLALYSIAGFVVLVSIWGIVNVISTGLGLNRMAEVCPDYFTSNGPGCHFQGWGNDPQGEFGGTPIPNETSNNGWSTRPTGEFGN